MKTPRPPWLLVLAVLALHLLLGHEVQRIQDGWASEGAPRMPPRMEVEFVREMVLQAPPAVRWPAPYQKRRLYPSPCRPRRSRSPRPRQPPPRRRRRSPQRRLPFPVTSRAPNGRCPPG
jgi:hypothetical protein